ncbi:hypothetical protein POSPLADRAFT_1140757 [Postia placenta MAD-698-R-SB12]|uniref:Uncharacterized protein n=1 Tax=Postia placenta MAD-698-R-SB12 TaxID=670580 RepID=A0A1X6N2W2_9APHY|nr:hypothetical protein POSPLADRAFT_1140757 [Postia placenta MAD-698-R-SB12]OSX62948.1 hypothetical protein POSPLADRAFT_1140757 [Postia placenta MAD-698-R-SB12]
MAQFVNLILHVFESPARDSFNPACAAALKSRLEGLYPAVGVVEHSYEIAPKNNLVMQPNQGLGDSVKLMRNWEASMNVPVFNKYIIVWRATCPSQRQYTAKPTIAKKLRDDGIFLSIISPFEFVPIEDCIMRHSLIANADSPAPWMPWWAERYYSLQGFDSATYRGYMSYSQLPQRMHAAGVDVTQCTPMFDGSPIRRDDYRYQVTKFLATPPQMQVQPWNIRQQQTGYTQGFAPQTGYAPHAGVPSHVSPAHLPGAWARQQQVQAQPRASTNLGVPRNRTIPLPVAQQIGSTPLAGVATHTINTPQAQGTWERHQLSAQPSTSSNIGVSHGRAAPLAATPTLPVNGRKRKERSDSTPEQSASAAVDGTAEPEAKRQRVFASAPVAGLSSKAKGKRKAECTVVTVDEHDHASKSGIQGFAQPAYTDLQAPNPASIRDSLSESSTRLPTPAEDRVFAALLQELGLEPDFFASVASLTDVDLYAPVDLIEEVHGLETSPSANEGTNAEEGVTQPTYVPTYPPDDTHSGDNAWYQDEITGLMPSSSSSNPAIQGTNAEEDVAYLTYVPTYPPDGIHSRIKVWYQDVRTSVRPFDANEEVTNFQDDNPEDYVMFSEAGPARVRYDEMPYQTVTQYSLDDSIRQLRDLEREAWVDHYWYTDNFSTNIALYNCVV